MPAGVFTCLQLASPSPLDSALARNEGCFASQRASTASWPKSAASARGRSECERLSREDVSMRNGMPLLVVSLVALSASACELTSPLAPTAVSNSQLQNADTSHDNALRSIGDGCTAG